MTKYIPARLSRGVSRGILKTRKASPTLFVVGGVVGFGVTVVMAAKASRQGTRVVSAHKAERASFVRPSDNASKELQRDYQAGLTELYYTTTIRLVRVYGPTVVVGSLSAASILYGHNLLRGRHVAALAAYSGLSEQFLAYRGRIQKTLGPKLEQEIFNGAHGQYVEDPNHKGEYKLQAVYDEEAAREAALRPWFDERNAYYRLDPDISRLHLQAVQTHMNHMLVARGHVFLNEVLDALAMPRVTEGQQLGWVHRQGTGDDYIDFGLYTSEDPNTLAYLRGEASTVQLNFNVDGIVWDLI